MCSGVALPCGVRGRDLASGWQLLWLPILHPDTDEALQALAALVAWYGPPLVLKTDNGSPFVPAPSEGFCTRP